MKPLSSFVRKKQADAINPSTLFLGSERGSWFDPTDLTTVMQTANGTEVTANNQFVGLLFDKSKNRTLGPEQVVNGTFDTAMTGWINNAVTTAVVDGVARLTTTTAASGRSYRSVPTENGLTYLMQSNNGSVDGLAATQVRITSSSNGAFTGSLGTTSTVSTIGLSLTQCYFTAEDLQLYIVLINSTTTQGAIAQFDNVSVKAITGRHATQVVTDNRPRWYSGGYIDLTPTSANMTINYDTAMGSNCTVVYATENGVVFLENQTIGTTYTLPKQMICQLLVIDRTLSQTEKDGIRTYFTNKIGNGRIAILLSTVNVEYDNKTFRTQNSGNIWSCNESLKKIVFDFELREGDIWSGDVGVTPTRNRSELSQMNSTLPASGQDIWVTDSILLPTGSQFLDSPYWSHVIQMHYGFSGANPVLSATFGATGFKIETCYSLESDSTNAVLETRYNDAEFPYDKWVSFVYRMRFSSTNTGLLQVWRDGVLIVDLNNINLGYVNDSRFAPYFKFGAYRRQYPGTFKIRHTNVSVSTN